MSRYRKVDPRIWNDEKFRTLTDNGKLVFFMLLTQPFLSYARATPLLFAYTVFVQGKQQLPAGCRCA